MEFDFSLIIHSIPLLLRGAGLTLEITALAVGLGLLIGLVASLAQLSKSPLLRLPAKVYVDCIRGTPLLIQIFIIYFALPNIIGHRIDRLSQPLPPVRLTPAHTLPKSSAAAFSPSLRGSSVPVFLSA